MKVAYMPDTHGGPYHQPEPSAHDAAQFCEQLLQEGIEAEAAGFDGVFLPERHHRTETMFPPPLVLLAAYTARTTRVDLGTFVLQPPYYNPMHLAEDVAMIDLLSKGRVILGVGLGYHPDYSGFSMRRTMSGSHASRRPSIFFVWRGLGASPFRSMASGTTSRTSC
jgi:alkanesulfonate monooxygenase SsuD/methylene tetrahydromethanopterin reductase-like flavin-dependent oxidoreductase (luciferase family)